MNLLFEFKSHNHWLDIMIVLYFDVGEFEHREGGESPAASCLRDRSLKADAGEARVRRDERRHYTGARRLASDL